MIFFQFLTCLFSGSAWYRLPEISRQRGPLPDCREVTERNGSSPLHMLAGLRPCRIPSRNGVSHMILISRWGYSGPLVSKREQMRSRRGWFLPLNRDRGMKSPLIKITSTDFGETGTFSRMVKIKSAVLSSVWQTEVILDQGFLKDRK